MTFPFHFSSTFLSENFNLPHHLPHPGEESFSGTAGALSLLTSDQTCQPESLSHPC